MLARRRKELKAQLAAKRANGVADLVVKALAEAETLHKRAERKRGLEAVPAYSSACAAYQQIADGMVPGANDEQKAAARSGQAACLADAADCLLKGIQATPDQQLAEAERAAKEEAMTMLEGAVRAYQQVRDKNGTMPSDALVDCGNALAALAELKQPAVSLNLLQQACDAYIKALEVAEDADTYSNLGDVLISVAERFADADEVEKARTAYSDAMIHYDKACTISNSDKGDDLPGLLLNWGSGLHSAGSRLKDPAILQEAVMRLRSAKELGHSDVMIINALGDTFMALAELLPAGQERVEALRRALEEGFQASLRIDRRQPDALIGSAEARMMLGRGDKGQSAKQHFQQSLTLYNAALERPELLGSWQDRCEIRFNQACAACLAKDVQVAERLVRELLDTGAVSAYDLVKDTDFQVLQASGMWEEVQQKAQQLWLQRIPV